MRSLAIFILGLSSLLCGCEQDPARSIKIIARPLKSAAKSLTPAVRENPWHPKGCPPPPEATPGPFNVKGPCNFEQKAEALCKAKLDDFFVIIERKAADGAKLTVYLNVENYHGPGNYLLAQMHLSLQEGASLYSWSSDNVSVHVGPDEAFVEMPTTRLEAEPLLNTCPPVVAADGSYRFPCTAKRLASPVDGTREVLSGKIVCAKDKDRAAD